MALEVTRRLLSGMQSFVGTIPRLKKSYLVNCVAKSVVDLNIVRCGRLIRRKSRRMAMKPIARQFRDIGIPVSTFQPGRYLNSESGRIPLLVISATNGPFIMMIK